MQGVQGWFKVHRKLFLSDIFKNEKLLKVFIYCLIKSTHSPFEQRVGRQKVPLKPGQFIFGRKKAAYELDMSESTVYDYINVLKSDGVINIKSTNKYSVVTVVNWDIYQSSETENNKKHNNKKGNNLTPIEQQNNTNKNVKNVKNKREEEDARKDIKKENPIQVYQENFGILKPILLESFLAWCDDVGDEIMMAAMKLAASKGGRTFTYIETILREWTSANLKHIDEVRAYEREKLNRRNNTVPFRRKKAVGEIDWESL